MSLSAGPNISYDVPWIDPDTVTIMPCCVVPMLDQIFAYHADPSSLAHLIRFKSTIHPPLPETGSLPSARYFAESNLSDT
jgi:hypothetical protein